MARRQGARALHRYAAAAGRKERREEEPEGQRGRRADEYTAREGVERIPGEALQPPRLQGAVRQGARDTWQARGAVQRGERGRPGALRRAEEAGRRRAG